VQKIACDVVYFLKGFLIIGWDQVKHSKWSFVHGGPCVYTGVPFMVVVVAVVVVVVVEMAVNGDRCVGGDDNDSSD